MKAICSAIGAARAIAVAAFVPGVAAAHADCGVRKPTSWIGSTWATRAPEVGQLRRWQSFRDSTRWRLTKAGVVLCGERLTIKPKERYRLDLVPKAWARYEALIRAAARHYGVPAEMIISVMINESALKPGSHQKYRGYVSDDGTPHRISVGLGATLISTARYMLGDDAVDRAWLADPANSIRMIGLYLDRYYPLTGFDPPRVAAAYNSGGLHPDPSKRNRWRMRNFPPGHGIYIDHFVAVMNAAMAMFAQRDDRPPESLASIFYGPPKVEVPVEIPPAWTDRGGKLVLYRAPRSEMGVASSSIIDEPAPSNDESHPKACATQTASCSAIPPSEPFSARH